MGDSETKMMIRRVGVIGMGLLGRGIAACLLARGLEAIVYDRDQTMEEPLLSYLNGVMREIAEHCPALLSHCAGWQERFHWAARLDDLKICDLAIESVSEVLAVKRELLGQLEEIVGEEVALASNTSALPITELQRGLAHPERVVGMHWAEPAFATRFLELIGGKQTSASVLENLRTFAQSLGKEPSVVNDLPGFIANRLGYATYREAMNLLEQGVADAATIDRSYRNAAGLWASFCGPFRWIDITGGPALYARAMRGVLPDLSCTQEVPAALEAQVKRDAMAIAADRSHATTGFYKETAEERQAWLELLHRQAWEIEALRTRMDEAMKAAGVTAKMR